MINNWISSILGATLLLLASSEAFARDVPEPESIALIGIGAAAFLVSRRKRK